MKSDEFILFHTYANHVMDQSLDPFEWARFLVERGLFNGMMIWVDHQKRFIEPPPVQWLKDNDLAILFEFYTNDHYAVPCAKMEGYGSDLTAYNEWWCRKILDYLEKMGPGRSFWGLGHEHYDSFGPYPKLESDGRVVEVTPKTRQEGFQLYRQWVTTNVHQLHWGQHRYQTLEGFRTGRMTDQPDTFTFLSERRLAMPHGLMVGGVLPQNAAYQFEIFPQQEVYWWECLHPWLPAIQVGMCFLRGAAEQYGRKILVDTAPYSQWRALYDDVKINCPEHMVSSCMGPYHTCYDAEGRRLAGYSESMHLRAWMSLWAGGVHQMLHEDSIASHFLACGAKMELSPLGKAHELFADLALRRGKDRGTIIRTAGIVLPFLHGLCPPIAPGRMGWWDSRKPWHGVEPTDGDWSIAHFFEAAFPDHGTCVPWPYGTHPTGHQPEQLVARRYYGRMLRAGVDLRAMEEKHLTSSRWGNGFDVLLDNAPLEVLKRYPALVVLGDFEADSAVCGNLVEYVKAGGRALVSAGFTGLEELGITVGAPVRGGKTARFADGTSLTESVEYSARPVAPSDKDEIIASDENGLAVTAKHMIVQGEVWLIALDNLLGRQASGALAFPALVLQVLDRFLEPTTPLKLIGPPMEWCVARNRRGLRIYLANHNPFDAMPTLRFSPQRLGFPISAQPVAHELVEDRPVDLKCADDELDLEVVVPAFAPRLLDIVL